MTSNANSRRPWWRDAVFYQIYPLSFSDSNGNGFGDLEGIISKLDYLADTLGVDALWISPFYRSPMSDWGYDVSDHTDVDPLFGDLAVAKSLIEEAHERGMRVIFDYLMNHTSIKHSWFIESRSSKDNPKRDWYVWRDPKDGGLAPTNWVSVFGGPAWTLDETTGQYYRHTYLPNQPDLNWRNPELVEAMLDVARFWLDLGVDGFRVDAAHQMMKDPEERDNPPVPEDYERPWKDMGEYDNYVHLHDLGHRDVHEAHQRFRSVVDTYTQKPVTVGEIHIFDLGEWASYYGENLDQLHMPFNFHLMACEWDANSLRATVEATLRNVPEGAWTNWLLGNHDERRLATRLGLKHARLAAMLLLSLRGTPFLYYGDELGMTDTVISPEEGMDPWGKNVDYLSRDGARTPMQWSSAMNAGFTTGTPWLPLGDDVESTNVATELENPKSMLNLYRRLIAVRQKSEALRAGSFLVHPASNDQVLVYRRESKDEIVTVALNLSHEPNRVDIGAGTIVVSTMDPDRTESVAGKLLLEPYEGVLVANK